MLHGALFASATKANTVVIAITGIHGNFYSNPFYYNFGQIPIYNAKTGEKEMIGSFNEDFNKTIEDVSAYVDFAEQQAEIVKAFGKAVACVPNQSAQSILISFEQKPMWYQDNRPVAIAQISNGKITPNLPTLNKATLQNFLAKRPLISLTEIRYAFNLTDKQTVLDWLNQVQNEWRWVDGEFVGNCEI